MANFEFKVNGWAMNGMEREIPFSGEYAERQSADDAVIVKSRARTWWKAGQKKQQGTTHATELSKILEIGLTKAFWNVEKWGHYVEYNTGIPMHKMVRWISRSLNAKNNEYYKLVEPYNRFGKTLNNSDI